MDYSTFLDRAKELGITDTWFGFRETTIEAFGCAWTYKWRHELYSDMDRTITDKIEGHWDSEQGCIVYPSRERESIPTKILDYLHDFALATGKGFADASHE